MLFLQFLFLIQVSFSQKYVFDSINKTPISGVNIYLNDSTGVATNKDGYFEFPEGTILDSIYFSHLSYKFKRIAKDQLKQLDTIYLDKNSIKLDEVLLRNIDARNVVIEAIEKIDENYLSKYNSYGFYRQTITEDSMGVEMIEVNFFSNVNKNKVSVEINSARRTTNLSKLGIKTFGGASAMIENGDFVRSKAQFLNHKNIENYKFSYKGHITYNNLSVLKIGFIPVSRGIEVLRKGDIYIDQKSLAILEVKYTFDAEKLMRKTESSERDLSKNDPIYRLKHVENVIKYKQLPNKKWYLSYIEAYNLRKGMYHDSSFDYAKRAKLVVNNLKLRGLVKVKPNYKTSDDFGKAIKEIGNIEEWDNTYKLSLSEEEKKILSEIKRGK